jgi:hypothetical protein
VCRSDQVESCATVTVVVARERRDGVVGATAVVIVGGLVLRGLVGSARPEISPGNGSRDLVEEAEDVPQTAVAELALVVERDERTGDAPIVVTELKVPLERVDVTMMRPKLTTLVWPTTSTLVGW